MAGIEKICEFSGEYCGGRMYTWKYNQLQILPKYRKLFRGDKGVLVVSKESDTIIHKDNFITRFCEEEIGWYDPPFTDVYEYKRYLKDVKGVRFGSAWMYTYITTTPTLQGKVNGKYVGYTYDLPILKRKMKRLLRCKKLNIVYKKDI